MSNPSKAKGTKYESAIVTWLRAKGWPRAERRTLNGAYDMGDINIHPAIVIEAKNTKSHDLAKALDEAERERNNANAEVAIVLLHRRGTSDVGQDYAFMTADTANFLLLKCYGESS